MSVESQQRNKAHEQGMPWVKVVIDRRTESGERSVMNTSGAWPPELVVQLQALVTQWLKVEQSRT